MTRQTTTPTDLELTALAVLREHHTANPRLRAYLDTIRTDPDAQALPPPDLVTAYEYGQGPEVEEAYADDPANCRLMRELDEYALHLATTVALWRRDGRPTADYSTHPHTDTTPTPWDMLWPTTSLPAEVARYIRRVQNAWATYARERV